MVGFLAKTRAPPRLAPGPASPRRPAGPGGRGLRAAGHRGGQIRQPGGGPGRGQARAGASAESSVWSGLEAEQRDKPPLDGQNRWHLATIGIDCLAVYPSMSKARSECKTQHLDLRGLNKAWGNLRISRATPANGPMASMVSFFSSGEKSRGTDFEVHIAPEFK